MKKELVLLSLLSCFLPTRVNGWQGGDMCTISIFIVSKLFWDKAWIKNQL